MAYLNLLNKYLPDSLNKLKYHEKHNPEFLTDLKQLADNYKARSDFSLSLQSFSKPDDFSIENVAINANEFTESNELNINTTAGFENMRINKENVQFNQFNLTLPIKAKPSNEIVAAFLCMNNLYQLLCMNNIGHAEWKTLQTQLMALISGEIENANFAITVDTYPPANNPQQINGKLDVAIAPTTEKNPEKRSWFEWANTATLSSELNIPVALVSDMSAAELSETAKLKLNSQFWKNVKEGLDGLTQHFKSIQFIEDEQYRIKFERKNQALWLNGINLDELPPEEPTPIQSPEEEIGDVEFTVPDVPDSESSSIKTDDEKVKPTDEKSSPAVDNPSSPTSATEKK